MRKKIIVDGQEFASRKKALEFYEDCMYNTEGSEQDRMAFAYLEIKHGHTNIDTYRMTCS